jgi:hypothetical protein
MDSRAFEVDVLPTIQKQGFTILLLHLLIVALFSKSIDPRVEIPHFALLDKAYS